MASLRAGFVVADEIIIRELINRIFQEMDSSPDLVGQALAGAFNTTSERMQVYDEYFKELRQIYMDKFDLLKVLVDGIDSIDKNKQKRIQDLIEETIGDEKITEELLKGLSYVTFPQNLTPESGFFALLDFTKIKGMKYKGMLINNERDLLKFFYNAGRVRFLIGQSFSWPYADELIGRITFALDDAKIIKALKEMHYALEALQPGNDYIIRKNNIEDQAQMARIKIDGWRNAYDKIISSKYLNELNYEQQTQRYIASFEEYKDLVLVAVKEDKVLGYSCFNKFVSGKYDSELVSLYIHPKHIGKGIGRSLFLETVKELHENGKKNMIVWCFKDNIKALKFYKKLGGSIVETKESMIGQKTYVLNGIYFDLDSIYGGIL